MQNECWKTVFLLLVNRLYNHQMNEETIKGDDKKDVQQNVTRKTISFAFFFILLHLFYDISFMIGF